MLVTVIFLLLSVSIQATESFYPGRDQYPQVPYISTDEFRQFYDQAIIIDARSKLEYETIHIPKAYRHSAYDDDFVVEVTQLRNDNPDKKIIFYCNGHSCMKSYQATQRAIDVGINNVMTYDSGIFEWTEAYPELSVLVGKSPVDLTLLRAHKERFSQHIISIDEFVEQVRIGDSVIFDVRTNKERYLSSPLFLLKDKSLSFNNITKMMAKLKKLNDQHKSFLFYDVSGRTVVWLDYYLAELGIKNYSYMQGGAYEFSKLQLKHHFFQDTPEKEKIIDALFVSRQ
jgi:rhodanese-related sulfurtransferase